MIIFWKFGNFIENRQKGVFILEISLIPPFDTLTLSNTLPAPKIMIQRGGGAGMLSAPIKPYQRVSILIVFSIYTYKSLVQSPQLLTCTYLQSCLKFNKKNWVQAFWPLPLTAQGTGLFSNNTLKDEQTGQAMKAKHFFLFYLLAF